MRVKLPRLLNAQMQEKARLHPSEMDITFNLHSPYIASAVLPPNDAPVALHDWVRLHTVKGDAGVFRVTDIGGPVGEETHLSLQHGICILKADKPKTDEEAIEGSLSEVLAQLWAMEGVNETPQYWQLGSIPQTGKIRYVFGSQNLLQAVQTIMKQVKGYVLSFDQSIFPWVLNVEKLPESVSCEGRFSRNLESVNIDMDDADLVTRVYIHGKAGFTDADTIGQWGVYSEILTVSEDATEESLSAYVADYLEAHKNPNVTIELSGVDLSLITGEKLDSFELGTVCRACLPQYRATVQERIISIAYRDVYGDPGNVRISMSNAVETTPDLLLYNERETTELSNSTSRRFGGVGAAIEQNRFEIYRVDTETAGRFNEVWFNMDAQSARIDLMATREELTEVDYTLSQVSIALDAAEAEIELRAKQETVEKIDDRLTGAEATLIVQAGQISTKVSENGVISSINQTAEEIKIQASRINLSGYVTATAFEAEMAIIDNVFAGYSEISALGISGNLYAANARFTDNLSIFNRVCTWRDVTMGEVASSTLLGAGLGGALDLQHSHAVTVDASSGLVTLGEVSATGGNFNIADTTFYKNGVSASYNKGKTDWSPVKIERTDYSIANKSVTVRALNAAGVPLIGLEEIDASEIYAAGAAEGGYDEGYAAGYQAAVDAITIGYSSFTITNTAANTFFASARIWAKVDGETVQSSTITKTQTINVGQ